MEDSRVDIEEQCEDLSPKVSVSSEETTPLVHDLVTPASLDKLIETHDLYSFFAEKKAKRASKPKRGRKRKTPLPSAHSNTEDHRHGLRTEQEEDAEMLEEAEEAETILSFDVSPAYIHGTMRPYQIQGLNWLISLHDNGISGILADEMGLGKTLQTISVIGYLKYFRNINGPHLFIVPKSTLQNWINEFTKWTPEIKTLCFHGDAVKRKDLIQDILQPVKFEVCVTTYEMCLIEKTALKKMSWKYLVIDEAHRIKNEKSVLSQIVRLFNCEHRLLITGTPLQNNLHELWALLNFLLPDVFSSSEDFDSWFESKAERSDGIIMHLKKLLEPFLLRRLKSDVEHSLLPKKEINLYVGMTDMQRKWYQQILQRDIHVLATGLKAAKTRLLNVVMQLRKCCNHPYLFDGAEPGPPFTTDEHLVQNSGKMILLDKLLRKMKENGSRVLIFSQMSRVLDILEDYCHMRGYDYCRIDGQTSNEDRVQHIEAYNAPDSEKFIFLLTTRAGGLGINLATADIVILFDSDWNPQCDLQAQDRAHRIGQKKQVYVFRFVTEKSIEEKVLERALQKLRLDQIVIQQGKGGNVNKTLSQGEILGMIQFGTESLFGESDVASTVIDESIEDILKKGEERTRELKDKYAAIGLEDLQKASGGQNFDMFTWEGEDYRAKQLKFAKLLAPKKRERKANYAMKAKRIAMHAKAPHPPRQPQIWDFQFYPPLLYDLLEREALYYQKTIGYQVTKDDDEPTDDACLEESQRRIDEAQPLTEAETEIKNEMLKDGFSTWTKRDYTLFTAASARYGRENYGAIAEDIQTKTHQEVEAYAKVFWDRIIELSDCEKILASVGRGEKRLKRTNEIQDNLMRKLEEQPLDQLKLNYGNTKGRVFTEAEDKFLLKGMLKHGYGNPLVCELIRHDIQHEPLFVFDWFFKSRSSADISKRCGTLVTIIEKGKSAATVDDSSQTKDSSMIIE